MGEGTLKFCLVWIFNFPVLYDCPLKRKKKREKGKEEGEKRKYSRRDGHHQPGRRSPRRKNVEKRGMYRARGNISSGGYIFLRGKRRVALALTCVCHDCLEIRQFIGCITARGQARTCELLEREINTATLFARTLGNSPIGFALTWLLHRCLLFINTFLETVFDLVSWESVISSFLANSYPCQSR